MNELIQGTEEWLSLRLKSIGSSDAPVIMGVSPWKTPIQLWEEKLGLSNKRFMNPAMQRGHDMEKEALRTFEEITEKLMFPRVVKHPTIPWMIASLDGMSFDNDCLVEIKCPGKVDHEKALRGEIPEKYYPQMQHQFEVTGLDFGYYFSYTPQGHAMIEVKRDQNYINQLLKKEHEFWDCVANFTMPDLMQRDCVQIEDAEWIRLAQEFKRVQTDLKMLEDKSDELKKKLVSMADGKNACGGGITLSKIHRKGAVDNVALAEAAKLDIEKYRKTSTTYWKVSA